MVQTSWLNDAVRAKIEIECLKIESEWTTREKALFALFSAYAEEYCAAGAPDGDTGPLEGIPALVYETAVKRGWLRYPPRRFVPGVRAVFKGFDRPTNLKRAGWEPVPESELTETIGKYRVTRSCLELFRRVLYRPTRACLARIREMQITSSPARPNPDSKKDEICVFKKAGDVWSLRFSHKDCTVVDSVGMLYIARLLAAYGGEIDAETLSAKANSDTAGGGRRPDLDRQDRDALTYRSEAQEQFDGKTKQDLRNRLRLLRDNRETAMREEDHEELERIDQETAKIEDYLTQGTGLGGRTRTFTNASRRAANRVNQAVRRAIDKIELKDAALAVHLRHSLKLGNVCSYQPEKPLVWDVQLR